ncbi:hypothetical protein ABZV75_34285 [Streptomyces flaveolus]|uniref:hypothetical protein n=1 Tax=Streptomyces flaveolus TaxID=67297 RepID=UPI0033BB186C
MDASRRQTEHGPARLAAGLQRPHGMTLAPTLPGVARKSRAEETLTQGDREA